MFKYIGIYASIGVGVAVTTRVFVGTIAPPPDDDIVAWNGWREGNLRYTHGLLKIGFLWPLIPLIVLRYVSAGRHHIIMNSTRPVLSFIMDRS